ncbi:unnamed protein product, partial [marine sediment metagenome]
MHYGITYTRRMQYGQFNDITIGFLNKYNEKGSRHINFSLRI